MKRAGYWRSGSGQRRSSRERAPAMTDGAKGRNGSRNLILVLTMSFMAARRGVGQDARGVPSARGPHSKRPWNQPTTCPGREVAPPRRVDQRSSWRTRSWAMPCGVQEGGDVARRVLLAPDGVLHHEAARLAEDHVVARTARLPARRRRRRPPAGCTAPRTGVSRRMRPLATLLSATPPARHRRASRSPGAPRGPWSAPAPRSPPGCSRRCRRSAGCVAPARRNPPAAGRSTTDSREPSVKNVVRRVAAARRRDRRIALM